MFNSVIYLYYLFHSFEFYISSVNLIYSNYNIMIIEKFNEYTLISVSLVAIAAYCTPLTAPVVAATTFPTSFSTTVTSTTLYQCSFGYTADPLVGTPTITCSPYNATTGNWTLNNGACDCKSSYM